MLLANKKIAIVGGGTGGLTLATLLQGRGADVQVYERDLNKFARVQGSPLDLHEESGLAALAKAGLLIAFKENYLPGADRKLIVDEHAKIFFSDHESKVEENFGNPYFRPEIDRGALRKILLDALAPDTVVWDCNFQHMEQAGQGWLLHFKDRESLYADIVIAAEGANSKIRPYITSTKPFYTGICMLEGNVYDAKTNTPQIHALLNGGKIMAFGNERNILMGQKGNGDIGFYASFKADEDWVTSSRLDYNDRQEVLAWFKQAYPTWSDIWATLFEHAALPFIPRPIYCMPANNANYGLPNLTMLGDAAHVMPPFAGEGVNMAMLDALELSEALTSSDYESIQAAIASFEQKMYSRAALAAQESLDNGERMHSPQALAHMLALFTSH
ncbi:FAD-dependent oxidoreductase [Sphingobacterium bambusae]|uniref:Flavin-dependent monooxygenase n=1 Tax=Sphingobacterium bambusae TaxID=662858 RepID=A0ABW6B989_9SPHI|nr:FAD-dependent monooxygenase [Sphingobacterium bambusae]WPL49171.1 FAD-dependent monooxygenase [Sphingobacterium bambusae]